MAVGDASFDPWHLVHLLWGLLLGMIMWFARKIVGDVEELKSDKADKKDMQGNFNPMAENNRQLVARIDDHYKTISQRLDTVMLALTTKRD
jgi:uncharacterized membrane protein (DUF106 family)